MNGGATRRGEHDHPAGTAKLSQAAAQNRRTALPRYTEGAHQSATTQGKSHTSKASKCRRHQPKTAWGVSGRCVGTRLDGNQEPLVGARQGGWWALGGWWSFCRQPCVFGALRASTRPVGDAPSLRFGRGQTPRQRRRAPALAPLGRASLTPKKS